MVRCTQAAPGPALILRRNKSGSSLLSSEQARRESSWSLSLGTGGKAAVARGRQGERQHAVTTSTAATTTPGPTLTTTTTSFRYSWHNNNNFHQHLKQGRDTRLHLHRSNVTRAGQAEPKPVHVKPFIALEKRVDMIINVGMFSVFSTYTTLRD